MMRAAARDGTMARCLYSLDRMSNHLTLYKTPPAAHHGPAVLVAVYSEVPCRKSDESPSRYGVQFLANSTRS
jgi:hypothetical protein